MITLRDVIDKVEKEFNRATAEFGPFHTAHEGWAILKEEFDELWEAIKLHQSAPQRNRRIREEAIQVAAMAVRLIVDCCEEEKEKPFNWRHGKKGGML